MKLLPLGFLLSVAILVASTFSYVFWNDVPQWLSSQTLAALPQDLRFIVGSFSWAMLAYCSNRLAQVLVWDGWFQLRTGRPVPKLLQSVFAACLYVIAATAVVAFVFDRSPKFLLAATGGASLVVGFALQSIIADFFAGIILTVQRPFSIGDFVTVGDEAGTVNDISWRATQLLDANSRMVIIPNNKVLGGRIINATYAVKMCSSFTLVLDYEVDVPFALELLQRAASRGQPAVEGKEPKVVPFGVGEGGVTYRVQFWYRDQSQLWPAQNAVLAAIQQDLKAAGLRYSRSVTANVSSRLTPQREA